jgi:hypothetical protein
MRGVLRLKRTGFLRQRLCSTSHAHVRAQAGGTGPKVESATGDSDPGAPRLDDAVKGCGSVHG